MSAAPLWLLWAAHWGLILGWSLCHRQISAARRRMLTAGASRGATTPPRVTVILPAKDEAENLAGCAARILAQRGVDLELVIVDDRSTDRTPEIADRLSAEDARCRTIHNRQLPAEWMGKSHACHRGAADARGEWLLFTDADVRLEPDAVAAAIARARAERLDLLSLWPRDDSRGFWERLLVPLCGAMIVIWYGHVAARSNARGEAFANGQFLLIRGDAYRAAGGHAAVRSALIEDIALARAAAARGLAVGSAPAPDLVGVRMYRSLIEVARGWQRIYAGVLSPAQIAGCVLSLLLGSLLPIVLVPWLAFRHLAAGGSYWDSAWLLSASVQLIVLASVSVRFFGLARCDRRFLWLYPASVLGVLWILVAALRTLLRGRSVEWRGTRYAVRSGGSIAPGENPAGERC